MYHIIEWLLKLNECQKSVEVLITRHLKNLIRYFTSAK